jgi:hypothetical protein
MTAPEFIGFPKMARHSRQVIVTEKIDGTNAQVHITEAGEIFAGSRTRWITPADDNYGFARCVDEHRGLLLGLGPGSHFGEWWGAGIQRRYGVGEKRFSLFNASRWGGAGLPVIDTPPVCCLVVPVLWVGPFDQFDHSALLETLKTEGSVAAPGFMNPEGIVIWHTAAKVGFKKTIEKDDEPKGAQR